MKLSDKKQYVLVAIPVGELWATEAVDFVREALAKSDYQPRRGNPFAKPFDRSKITVKIVKNK